MEEYFKKIDKDKFISKSEEIIRLIKKLEVRLIYLPLHIGFKTKLYEDILEPLDLKKTVINLTSGTDKFYKLNEENLSDIYYKDEKEIEIWLVEKFLSGIEGSAKEILKKYFLQPIWKIEDMEGEILRHATIDDYAKWLTKYVKKGNKITYYNKLCVMPDSFYIVNEDISKFYVPTSYPIDEMYSSVPIDEIYIIVPEGVEIRGEENYIIKLLSIEDPKRTSHVPVFINVLKYIKKEYPSIADLIENQILEMKLMEAKEKIESGIEDFNYSANRLKRFLYASRLKDFYTS